MEQSEKVSLTQQLRRYTGTEHDIAEAVLRQVLPKLHQVAVSALRREHNMPNFSPTELINEVWLRSLHKGNWKVNNRNHFYAIAALAMRRVLIDLARSRNAATHGSGATVLSLTENGNHPATTVSSPESVVKIGILMEKLEEVDPQVARVVDMHYFTGFSIQEITQFTGLTERQIRSRWKKGQNWLKARL